jgi:hypothetical protein
MGKKLFSLWTVHPPISPLSTLWARPSWWTWIRARFYPRSLVSALEAGLRGLFASSLMWVFWGDMGCLVLVLEDGGQHLIFCAGIFVT